MPRLKLHWSRAALLDIQRLYRFLVPKNPDAAKRAVKAIRAGVQVLTHQPGIGRPVDDLPENFREWLIDFGHTGHVARYSMEADKIVMLAIRHQREAGF